MQRCLGQAAMMMVRDGVETRLHHLQVFNPKLKKVRDEEEFFDYVGRHYLHKFDPPNGRY
jgi:hypothetical protein